MSGMHHLMGVYQGTISTDPTSHFCQFCCCFVVVELRVANIMDQDNMMKLWNGPHQCSDLWYKVPRQRLPDLLDLPVHFFHCNTSILLTCFASPSLIVCHLKLAFIIIQNCQRHECLMSDIGTWRMWWLNTASWWSRMHGLLRPRLQKCGKGNVLFAYQIEWHLITCSSLM